MARFLARRWKRPWSVGVGAPGASNWFDQKCSDARARALCRRGEDCLKIGGQAAIAIDGDESLAGLKMRPYVEPNVPL